jgi:2-keto-4-pentenoate hydratase/2-oxohepta-3-ene-1,7-dioic acid hydratase in catechol pathway
VHIGQPVDPKLDVGLASWNKQTIKAYEIIGSALDPAAQVTSTVLTVKELLAPLSREELKIVRCLGLNYSDHAAETKMALPAAPILFYKPLSSMIGPNAPICVPKVAQPVDVHLSDYEVELTIVIGKTAKNVSEAEALDYVLGYTAANDVSFRKHQMTTSQWGFSKGFDNTTPLGPCIVSNNAIPDPQVLPLTCMLNGKTLQNGNTKDQIFNVRQTVAFLSQATTLEPGSIILTGTPAGVGFARKPAVVLKHGDDCRVWIGHGIGTLVNTVVEEGKRGAKL